MYYISSMAFQVYISAVWPKIWYDPDSENGHRMLKHELTHISEKHSADKLLTELLLTVFWINPFFWLIKKEFRIIHEFIADQKAIQHNDASALAAMILQTVIPFHSHNISNHFFQGTEHPHARRWTVCLAQVISSGRPDSAIWCTSQDGRNAIGSPRGACLLCSLAIH